MLLQCRRNHGFDISGIFRNYKINVKPFRLNGGVSGGTDEAVDALLAGRLTFDPDVHCDHHGHHGEGHHCREDKHGCLGNGGIGNA